VRHAAATALARMAVTTPALLRQTWPLVRGDIEASTHDDGLRKSTIRSFSHHIDYCPSDCGPAHSDHMQHEDESHSDHHDRQQTLEYDNLLSVIATCPFCGERTFVFVTASDDYICPWCGKSLSLHKKYNEFSDDLYETFPGAHRERGYCEPDF
jgi:hypothetical protein